MPKKFPKSIGRKKVEDLIQRIAGNIPPIDLGENTLPSAKKSDPVAGPIGCCAIVVNNSTHLRPTTREVCDKIEEELDGAGSTQWFEDPCRHW
jgi:hypothetical protein